MTNTTIGIGSFSNGATNTAYVWHSVPSYSAFGSYTGDGSDDGPFVYTGMKVGWVLIKGLNSNNWHIRDTTRLSTNPNDNLLYASLTDPESISTDFAIDMLSNGFKIRGTHPLLNTSGQEYCYCAFAENPFSSPVTAR